MKVSHILLALSFRKKKSLRCAWACCIFGLLSEWPLQRKTVVTSTCNFQWIKKKKSCSLVTPYTCSHLCVHTDVNTHSCVSVCLQLEFHKTMLDLSACYCHIRPKPGCFFVVKLCFFTELTHCFQYNGAHIQRSLVSAPGVLVPSGLFPCGLPRILFTQRHLQVFITNWDVNRLTHSGFLWFKVFSPFCGAESGTFCEARRVGHPPQPELHWPGCHHASHRLRVLCSLQQTLM